jgi:hypothetical protein
VKEYSTKKQDTSFVILSCKQFIIIISQISQASNTRISQIMKLPAVEWNKGTRQSNQNETSSKKQNKGKSRALR